VDGRFSLLRFLGGSDGQAVFLTKEGSGGDAEQAVIRFVPGTAGEIAGRLADWEAASQLTHAHLLRIFAGGEYRAGDRDCAYVVTEYAAESLAMLPPDQPLTAPEARDMLAAVLSVLEYLHAKGFAHGRIEPSAVRAQDEKIKLASNTIVRSGDTRSGPASPAADMAAVGQLLQQCIPALPEPFGEIVSHSMDADPQRRWSAAQAAARLRLFSARRDPEVLDARGHGP